MSLSRSRIAQYMRGQLHSSGLMESGGPRDALLLGASAAFAIVSLSLVQPVNVSSGVFSHWALHKILVAASGACFAACVLHVLRQSVKRRIALSNAQFKAVIDQALESVVLADPITQRLVYMNKAAQEMFGVESEQLKSKSIADIFVVDVDSVEQLNDNFVASHPRALGIRRRHSNGSELEVEARFLTAEIGGKAVWAYTSRDVSVQKKVEQQLVDNQNRLDRIAHHDQLTGLPNRHYIGTFLPGVIEEADAVAGMIGIVFVDLDHFKNINDTQGHEVGDRLLQVVAKRLSECVRDEDVVVRMGGDEFVIIFRNIKSVDEVTRSANRIIDGLAAPVIIDTRQLQTSASLGISIYPRDGKNMMELLKHSDTAMYQAKDRGRSNVQIFDPIMNKKLKHRVTVETMLREALQKKQLEVHYQPFVNLSTRKVVGLEALIRWRHPGRGMIPADWFIPVAEETGLILPIGDFVLHRAMQDLTTWRRAGASLVPVSVNVAASQLLRGDFQAKLSALLLSYEVPAKLLQLEMTERAIFDARAPKVGEKYQDTVGALRDKGIKIAIDDFGTGYSSLAYLKNWRVDTLKIDRSFIRDLGTDSSDYAIVSAIIAIARHLHIEVIAEGVEAYQQADILRDLGCQQAQGFLFARPMPAQECLSILGKGQVLSYNDDELVGALAALGD